MTVISTFFKCHYFYIYALTHVLTERALYILYCSLALPYMSYCAEIWGNTYRTNVLPVFIKQKRLLRIVCRGKRVDHTTPLFYKMHALKLFDLIKLNTAVVMFKAYNNMLPVNLQKLFVRVEPIRRTRNVNMFERRFVRTEVKSMSLSNWGGLNCGMVLKSILKVVAMYRYSRNVLKKSVYILMIKLADSIEYKLCERCKPGMVLY